MNSGLREEKPEASWSVGRFSLLLAALMLLTFPGPLLFAQSFVFRDFGIFGYPLAAYHRHAFWAGELPLWNPYNSCGLPFVAQWNTLVFYPLSALYLFLPLPWSVTFFCLFHLWWGGVGTCHLVKTWTGNGLAGWCAGTAFVFNGLALNCLMWPNNVAALAWLPWLLFAVRQASNLGGRWIAVGAAVAAVQLLAGAPEIILFSWLFVAGFAFAARLVPLGSALLRVGIVIVLAALLAAVQLLPFFDLLVHSQRHSGFGVSTWSMPAWGWLNLVVPFFRSYQSPAGVFFQDNQDWTSSYYPGVIVLLLAFVALGRRTAWIWLLAIFGLTAALGEKGIVYSALQKMLPFLGFMQFPIKFVVLAAISWPLLAGFTIATWQSAPADDKKQLKYRLAIAAGILALAAIGACLISKLRPYPFESLRLVYESAASRILFLGAALLVLIKWSAADSVQTRQIAGLGIVLLIWLDGWTHAPSQNPLVPPSVMVANLAPEQFATPPQLGKERAFVTKATHDNFHRTMISDPFQDFLLRRIALRGNCNLLDRIPTPDGFYSLYLPDQRRVWEQLFFAPTNQPTTGVLDFLGVSQMSVSSKSEPVRWERRADGLPLATIGQRPAFVPSSEIIPVLYSTHFKPKEVVLFSEADKSQINVRSNSIAKILHSSVKPHQLVFDVEASNPTLLVCSQTFYHPWKAEIDGSPVRIFKANGAFQAVEVPAGSHRIVFTYRDGMFWAGCLCSGAGLILLFIIWFKKPNSPVGSAQS